MSCEHLPPLRPLASSGRMRQSVLLGSRSVGKHMRYTTYLMLVLCCYGCIAGGGAAYHVAPENIYVGKETNLRLKLTRGGNKNIQCHYRLANSNTYTSIEMQRISKSKNNETYECLLPAFDEEGFVDYYFDHTCYQSYNKHFEKTVKIVLPKDTEHEDSNRPADAVD